MVRWLWCGFSRSGLLGLCSGGLWLLVIRFAWRGLVGLTSCRRMLSVVLLRFGCVLRLRCRLLIWMFLVILNVLWCLW